MITRITECDERLTENVLKTGLGLLKRAKLILSLFEQTSLGASFTRNWREERTNQSRGASSL